VGLLLLSSVAVPLVVLALLKGRRKKVRKGKEGIMQKKRHKAERRGLLL
jgi:hypothetical protein